MSFAIQRRSNGQWVDLLQPDAPPPAATIYYGARCGPISAAHHGVSQTPPDYGGSTATQTRVQAAFGGRIGTERWYNDTNPWQTVRTVGTSTILSVTVDPAGTAAGNFDTQWLALLRSLNKLTWVSFNQEPDLGNKGTTATDYVAGLRYIKNVLLPQVHTGVDIRVTNIITGLHLYTDGLATMAQWWHPDLDCVGVDAYALGDYYAQNTTNLTGKLSQLKSSWQLAIDYAKGLGTHVIFPEAGFGYRGPTGGKGYDTSGNSTDLQKFSGVGLNSTQALAQKIGTPTSHQLLSEGIAVLEANADVVDAISWFESDKSDGDWTIEYVEATRAIWAAKCASSPTS
jgi:hypothetical protein